MPLDFLPKNAPVIRELLPLGLSYAKIAKALDCYELTVRNHVKRMGGIAVVAPKRVNPSKKRDIYAACLHAWIHGSSNEVVMSTLENELRINELRAFAHGLATSMEALSTPVFPDEFMPFAKICFGVDRKLDLPSDGSELIKELKTGVVSGVIETPKSIDEVRFALMKIHAQSKDREWVLAPFPSYMLEVCQQALALLKDEHPRHAKVLKLTAGIDCERQTIVQVGRDMEISRERVRQIEVRARRLFQRQYKQLLGHRDDGLTTPAMLSERLLHAVEARNRAEEKVAELHTLLDGVAMLAGSPEHNDLTDKLEGLLGDLSVSDLGKRVDEIEFPVRTANNLDNADIEYIYQLVERTEAEMLATKRFGRRSIRVIKEILSEFKPPLRLGMKLSPIVREQLEGRHR